MLRALRQTAPQPLVMGNNGAKGTEKKHRITMLLHRVCGPPQPRTQSLGFNFDYIRNFYIQSNNSFAKSTTYRTLDGSRPTFRKKLTHRLVG